MIPLYYVLGLQQQKRGCQLLNCFWVLALKRMNHGGESSCFENQVIA